MNQLANPDKLNRVKPCHGVLFTDVAARRSAGWASPLPHLARALESVSNRVTASQVELFSFLLRSAPWHKRVKPCQTVSPDLIYRKNRVKPCRGGSRQARLLLQSAPWQKRVKPCNRTLFAGKTVSNRVGERVGKLSLSSAQNRVKSCHWTLYSMKNRARPFCGGSRHAPGKSASNRVKP